MKFNLLIANALLCLAGLALPARAQEANVMVITVPFEFVVGATPLPAGTYTVSRTSSPGFSSLLIASRDNGAFLIPTAFDNTAVGDTSLTFDQIGGERVLSRIRTLDGSFTVDNRREAERLAKVARSNDRTPANGMTSSGGQ